MPCYYCAQENLHTDDHGNCTHCQVAVCVNPSGRWDNAFHGEACLCGCGRLVCEMHLLEHVQNAHGRDDGAACFPASWIAVGGGGIHGGAMVALEPGRVAPDPWHEITRFLNVVRPGHQALRTLTDQLPGLAVEWDHEWGRPGEP